MEDRQFPHDGVRLRPASLLEISRSSGRLSSSRVAGILSLAPLSEILGPFLELVYHVPALFLVSLVVVPADHVPFPSYLVGKAKLTEATIDCHGLNTK
jgi:hypothetical protein